jgi:aspartyl-tRNA(Asn)/glutamyl-tRNA(Gln) amidotransferase subunit A
MSIPAGQVEGWPVGVQLASQWGCEQVVMRVGECIEECVERGVN